MIGYIYDQEGYIVKNTKLGSKALLISFLLLLPLQLSAQQSYREGDRVLAEWSNKDFYPGKIGSSCSDGYQVLYDDGDAKCAPLNEIMADIEPAAADITVGSLVLAAWGSAFYPAKVASIVGGEYNVEYYDGYKQARALGELRIFAGAAAEENDFALSGGGSESTGSSSGSSSASETVVTDVLSEEITIWRGGSAWATIETDGDIWVGSSRTGSFEKDGDVWVGSSSAGDVESDGDIWFGSNDAGDIESDGDLWRGGSRIAEIESDGDIYLGGSRWGEADPFSGSFDELRAVAAVLVFFATEFGFIE